MLEKQIERELAAGVKRHGGLAVKFVSPGMAGVPDRLVLLPGGKIVFVELKAPGRKMSQRQVKVAKRLAEMGHIVRVIDSIEGIRIFLREVLAREV